MQNFIVLGLVPGTNFQITFAYWLNVILAIVGLLALRSAWRRRTAIHLFLAGLQIALIIDRGQVQA